MLSLLLVGYGLGRSSIRFSSFLPTGQIVVDRFDTSFRSSSSFHIKRIYVRLSGVARAGTYLNADWRGVSKQRDHESDIRGRNKERDRRSFRFCPSDRGKKIPGRPRLARCVGIVLVSAKEKTRTGPTPPRTPLIAYVKPPPRILVSTITSINGRFKLRCAWLPEFIKSI